MHIFPLIFRPTIYQPETQKRTGDDGASRREIL